jgi:hypothetical protein
MKFMSYKHSENLFIIKYLKTKVALIFCFLNSGLFIGTAVSISVCVLSGTTDERVFWRRKAGLKTILSGHPG